jgi:hypothetical protein
MTEGLSGIIDQLERQKSAIERALMALREVAEVAALGTGTPTSVATPEPSDRKGKKRSAAVRRRMKEAQQLRWAKIKGDSEPPTPATPVAPKAKRQISAEGMKRIIAATKKRWRLQKAATKSAANGAGIEEAAVKAPSAKTAKKIAPVKKAAVKKSASTPAQTAG